MLNIKINLILDGEFFAYAKVLFFKIKLFPRDKKNKKSKKSSKKKEKPKKQKKKTSEKTESKGTPKLKVVDYIYIIRDVSRAFFGRFSKHLHIKVAKIYVRVATGDAAQTAILYGAVSQALACLLEVLDSVTNLDKIEKAEIDVEPDYLSDKTEAKINITYSLRVVGILDILLKTLISFVKAKGSRAKALPPETDENKNNDKNK